jgi:trigger factor
MVRDKNVEREDNSSVKVTLTVDKDTVKNEYDKVVKDYAKNVHIKGFRKGKVPPEVLERKFGDSLKAEASQKIVEESFKEILDNLEEKPLPYAQPELIDELDFNVDKDFTFAVRYDTFPEIELGEYKGLTIKAPTIKVSDEDLERELTAIQEQNALVTDKDEGAVEDQDVVTLDYWEVDENDEPIEGTSREDFVFTVGTGYNYYKIDDDVKGMANGEEKIVEKAYDDDIDIEELKNTKKRIAMRVKAIKQRKMPDLDDELAQDVSDKYETLDDLKKDIKERLDETAKNRERQMKIDALMDQIAENSTVPLPESMVQAELDNQWRNFAQRYGMNPDDIDKILSSQGQGRESLYQEWRPDVEKNLKKRLLIGKIIEEEGVEATDEEIEEKIAEQAERSNMSTEEARDYFEKNNLMDYLKQDIQEQKVFDSLLGEATVKKGDTLNFLDAVGGNR